MDYQAEITKAINDYKNLNHLMDILLEKLRQKPQEKLDTWVQEVRPIFTEFIEKTKEHFNFEEKGGFMNTVLNERPFMEPVVEHLRNDHNIIINKMNELSRTCYCSDNITDCEIGTLCTELRNIISFLKHHEYEEDNLVQETLTVEIGTYD